ncbi:MAG: hypothetical protein OXT67_13710 [Zetaproteobacteria bacterium]|nr:hypothetical protein [Zetaproteobacteria bacterium]
MNMSDANSPVNKVAFVFGTLPEHSELDQILLLNTVVDVDIITPQSMSQYIYANMRPVQSSGEDRTFELSIVELPDHVDQLSFLPGLESVLANYTIVVVKERLGMYAFQAIKAKQQHHFWLYYWVDNGFSFPAEDMETLRTIREEVTRLADGFIVQSKACETALLLEGVHSEKMVSWPVWVNAAGYEVTDQDYLDFVRVHHVDRGHLIIAHIGQLEWEEGIGLLLEALAILKQKSPRVASRMRIFYCGLGSYSSVLQSRANRLKVDDQVRIVFPDRQNISTLLRCSEALHFGGRASRDRVETHRGLLWLAMAKNKSVILPRTVIGEDTLGKHRLDYCPNDPNSLMRAFKKVVEAPFLSSDIARKNYLKFQDRFDATKCLEQMTDILLKSKGKVSDVETGSYEKIIFQIEEAIGRGQYSEASSQIESILGSNMDLKDYQKAELYRLIGDCFTKLGDVDAGKQAYIKTCEYDPYSAKGHIGLGTISLIKGQHEIAIIQFQKSISLSPKDEMANLGLGLSFSGLEEYIEAKKWVESAIKINPDNSAAIYSLVRISHELEDYTSVLHVLEDYFVRHPMDTHMQYTYCGILYETKQYEKVIARLSEQLQMSPMDIRAQSLLKQAKRALTKEQEKVNSVSSLS